MMLSKLKTVGEWYQSEPYTGWVFDEISFDEEAKAILSNLDLDIVFQSSSANIKISNNHCFIPSQYFLYALKIKPLVLLLKEYMNIFSLLKNKHSAKELNSYLLQSLTSDQATEFLDPYSKDNFFNIFKLSDSTDRLGAKSIINIRDTSYIVRRNLDFFSSVLLKALPVPDASSGILGNILYALSNDTVAYEFLESRYAGSIPCIFQSADADEMVFRIFVCLGIQGKLNNILENKINQRYVSVDDFENIFQFSTTPIVGNKSYIETPIHFFENARKYVHVRKNIISDSASIDLFNNILEELCSNSLVVKDNGNFLFVSKSRGYYLSTINDGRNVIYYGAPGTGKSHAINEETKGSLKILTVFHPDTQYSDFVGALKPKMDSGSITYQFRPGPFTNALITAFSNPDKKVYLVIEEINRAPAAAVFGELFQLLDRENGASKYRINATDPDMIDYINEHLTGVTLDQLFIPGNLSLLATMNSSDQAVMPMDTAFKRRWSFKYIKIDFSQDAVPKQKFNITTSNGIYEISWPNFAQLINKELVKNRIPEDRLLGPFFLSYDELASSLSAKETLKGKLFVYLWNDVLRHLGTNKIFASSYNTFGDLADSFEMEKTVFNLSVEALIEAAGKPVAIENNDSKDDAVSE